MKDKKRLAIIILVCIIIVAVLIYFINNFREKENESQIDTIEKLSTYNNPIIPEGFKKAETDSASWKLENGIPKGWNDGLVIEDEIGNQFVWVPVNLADEEFYELFNKNNEYRKKDIRTSKQITKYGGFYIARYEAGVPDSLNNIYNNIGEQTNNIDGVPVIKKDRIVWNNISWKKAKSNATIMYQNSKVVESDLISYKQLECLRFWLKRQGYDIEDSRQWGNYSNVSFKFTGWYSTDYGKNYQYGENKTKVQYNMLLSTGASERNKSNNIYDLAGNVMEYVDVIENTINNETVLQYLAFGGYYDNISTYNTMSIYGINSKQGFRIVLYNK